MRAREHAPPRWRVALDTLQACLLVSEPVTPRSITERGRSSAPRFPLRTLRHVVCCGEALRAETVAAFYDVFDEPAELHNLYGPTEASMTWYIPIISRAPTGASSWLLLPPTLTPTWQVRVPALVAPHRGLHRAAHRQHNGAPPRREAPPCASRSPGGDLFWWLSCPRLPQA